MRVEGTTAKSVKNLVPVSCWYLVLPSMECMAYTLSWNGLSKLEGTRKLSHSLSTSTGLTSVTKKRKNLIKGISNHIKKEQRTIIFIFNELLKCLHIIGRPQWKLKFETKIVKLGAREWCVRELG